MVRIHERPEVAEALGAGWAHHSRVRQPGGRLGRRHGDRHHELEGDPPWRVAGCCFEIGAALLPEYRGQGLGTVAQQLLVDYLFRFTTVHRLEAGTDADNLAEQKVLERIGFTREGVLRQVAFRDGPGGTPWSPHSSATTSQDGETSHSLSWLWIDGSECQGLSIRSA
jgi:GNAT superfamily N-acetyltransferase